MKKSPTNTPASVLARLKNLSERDHLDFNFLLLRYIQERFLARLADSKHDDKFVLKGGFLLLAYNIQKARPTKDIDFLGINVSKDPKELENLVLEIISIDADDGVQFRTDSVKSHIIKEDADYEGVRIKIEARIGTTRNIIRLDFGFGDIVTPTPLLMDYPAILDRTSVKVRAYSKESIVAEKFEAIVKLSSFNSRMKDFYDIVFLSTEFNFEGPLLQFAIQYTFAEEKRACIRPQNSCSPIWGNRPVCRISGEPFSSDHILLRRKISTKSSRACERSWDQSLTQRQHESLYL